MAYIYGVIGATADTAITRTDNDGYAFGLGDVAWGSDGSAWVYVQANGAIGGAGYVVLLDEDWQAVEVNNSNTGSAFGQMVGVVATDFADNDYGWAQIFGVADAIQVAASCAANTQLATTGTDGQVDDAAAGGSENIDGMILTTARGGSAGTAPGLLTWPVIGSTN